MPATRPRVPGWHPDPDDPSFLRHWDGRRWGRERRPRPSWAPLTPGVVARQAAPGPAGGGGGGGGSDPGRGQRRRWGLLAGGLVLCGLLVIAVAAWLDSGLDIPARSVGDMGFTNRAEALCAEDLPALRADRPESREETGSSEEFARRIDRAADGLAGVAQDLRALPVAAADQAEIDGWLDDWDAYVAVGRRYADQIEAGDESGADEVADESSVLSTSIFVFARANGMPSCTL